MATTRKPPESSDDAAPAHDEQGYDEQAADDQDGHRNPRTLSESAQQVWLAGLGAFGRAQAEGSKLFDALVREGANLEQSARRVSRSGRAGQVRDAVEEQVEKARATASDSWSRFETGFEDRLTGVLSRMGVPTGRSVEELRARVDALDAEIARRDAADAAARRAADKPAAPPRARRAAAAKPAEGPGTGSTDS